MTEIPKTLEAQRQRYAIDPVAFVLALICAPLLVAVLGFWALIPVFAVPFGGPAYLALGTPVLLAYLHYRRGSGSEIALLALATVFAALIATFGYGFATDQLRALQDTVAYFVFGLFFGPLWGLTFGGLYNRWRSEISRRPLPQL